MKKTLFLLLALSLTFTATAMAGDAVTAYVSDSQCAKKHTDGSEQSVACVKRCTDRGADTVLVDGEGEVHVVANPDALKDHRGHQIKVMVTKLDDGKVEVDPESIEHLAP